MVCSPRECNQRRISAVYVYNPCALYVSEGTVMLSFPSKQIYDMYIEFCQFQILPFNNNGVFSDT